MVRAGLKEEATTPRFKEGHSSRETAGAKAQRGCLAGQRTAQRWERAERQVKRWGPWDRSGKGQASWQRPHRRALAGHLLVWPPPFSHLPLPLLSRPPYSGGSAPSAPVPLTAALGFAGSDPKQEAGIMPSLSV